MDPDFIELEDDYMVLLVPKETVWITLECKVLHNGEIVNVTKTMGAADVRKAFAEADRNYIPDDAEFRITDKGEQLLADLELERECRT